MRIQVAECKETVAALNYFAVIYAVDQDNHRMVLALGQMAGKDLSSESFLADLIKNNSYQLVLVSLTANCSAL